MVGRPEFDVGANASVATEATTTSVTSRLRSSGLRVTRGRLAVYSALADLSGHRSADEVHEELATRGQPISRASVYSALEVLARVGVVMAADAGPGRALYEAGATWHHHAVCRVCGAVADVDCVVGAKPCLEAAGDWGDVDEAQVIFRGICRSCSLEGHREPQKAFHPTERSAFTYQRQVTQRQVTKRSTPC